MALWTLVVWTLSSDPFSAESTSRILEPLLRWLWPTIPADTLQWIHFGVRKGAHLTEYAVLGILALHALRIGARRPLWHSAALALAFAAAVASLDEARQSRSVHRTGSVRDVGVDAAGAALGVALALGVPSREPRG